MVQWCESVLDGQSSMGDVIAKENTAIECDVDRVLYCKDTVQVLQVQVQTHRSWFPLRRDVFLD